MPDNSITRTLVRSVWQGEVPDFASVTDAESAGRVLTGLLSATLDFLAYRQLAFAPAGIELISNDRLSYLRFPAASERTSDTAVLIAHALAEHAIDANTLGEIVGDMPRWATTRILVLANTGGASIKRLDLDPLGDRLVSWHGPFDREQFAEIALAFTLLLTHLVATVFDGDDGSATFEESFEWVL